MNYISDNIVYSLNEISKDKPIVFIYTSDHGESPLTGRAHDSSGKWHPCLFWFT